ncbi:YciI family protein [Ruegeria sp. Ofav3-42]|uniref:YciI family protein n=1 Tax=Ruegeria sp. Ofav3-42 TaxID=2917759 RepID=UPI001EF433E3|nr:YciI family protein [Ruegeria sp. Ofav3-42]MCG7522470.1 YciI family protein [Ruegeria sp. Ofav3-42]
MKFIVLFEDAADADPGIRAAYMKDHIAFLESNAAVVEAAGPLTDGGKRGRDGLWIVEAEDQSAVVQLIHSDPFWPTGLRASYSILPWKQVYRDGRGLIPT